jgi:hypothetical protein
MKKYILYPLVGMFLILAGCAANKIPYPEVASRYPDVASVKKDTNHILVMPLWIKAPENENSSGGLKYERSLCKAASPALLNAIRQQGFVTSTFTVRSKGTLADEQAKQSQRDNCFLTSGKARRIAATYNEASNWTDPWFSRSQGITTLQSLFMVTVNEHADPRSIKTINQYCTQACYVAFPYLQIEETNGQRTMRFSIIVIEMSSPNGDLVSHVFGSKILQGNNLGQDQRDVAQLIAQTLQAKP